MSHGGVLRQVAFSPDSRLLATSSSEGTVKLWRVPDGTLTATLTHPAGVTSVTSANLCGDDRLKLLG